VPIPAARPCGIRVGWLARGQLSSPADVAVYPQQVPATTIDDHGNQITAITASNRGALAVTYTRGDGLTVQALTAHLKSKLLTFPGPGRPDQSGRGQARALTAERAALANALQAREQASYLAEVSAMLASATDLEAVLEQMACWPCPAWATGARSTSSSPTVRPVTTPSPTATQPTPPPWPA
jgi:hypothetical protein